MKSFRIACALVTGCLAALVLTTATASAHECFNASRSARADAVIAQHSHGWFDIHVSQLVAILVVSCAQQPSSDCPPPPLAPADMDALHNGDFEALVGEILGFAPQEPAITHLLAFTSKVEAEAACLGVPTHYLTLNNATAAGGTDKGKAGGVVSNGVGIEHFPEVYGQQIGAAYGTVLSGAPSACH